MRYIRILSQAGKIILIKSNLVGIPLITMEKKSLIA